MEAICTSWCDFIEKKFKKEKYAGMSTVPSSQQPRKYKALSCLVVNCVMLFQDSIKMLCKNQYRGDTGILL